MIQPPILIPGDTIGITCPAGSIPLEKVQNCILTLEKWGFKVKLGKTVGSKKDCFSASDTERAAELQQMLEGAAAPIQAKAHPANRLGHSEGILVGGNLCLMTHLIGSKNQLDTKGKILCIEDVGEYHYNVDRMLIQCKNAGLLDGLAGLVVGGFTEMKDEAAEFGETVIEIILRITKGAHYPICFDFPISHELNNMPVQLGAAYQLSVTDEASLLTKI